MKQALLPEYEPTFPQRACIACSVGQNQMQPHIFHFSKKTFFFVHAAGIFIFTFTLFCTFLTYVRPILSVRWLVCLCELDRHGSVLSTDTHFVMLFFLRNWRYVPFGCDNRKRGGRVNTSPPPHGEQTPGRLPLPLVRVWMLLQLGPFFCPTFKNSLPIALVPFVFIFCATN